MSPRLTAEPVGFFGRRFMLSTDGGPPRAIEFGTFSRRLSFESGGERWQVRSTWRGRITLERERDGYAAARAQPRGWFSFKYDVELADRRLELAPRGFWGRQLELRHGQRTVGRIRMRGAFGRRIEADLPDDLSEAVTTFIIVTVVRLQRRRAAAAAAAG